MKKTASIAGTVLATTLLLGACGGTDDDTDTPTVTDDNDATGTEDTTTETGTVDSDDTDTDAEGATTESDDSTESSDNASKNEDSDQDSMKEKMDKLSYKEFELEVDYGQDQEYEVEIEHDDGVIEASVEDELSNKNLNGREAFDELYPRLEKMDITETTSKDEAIKQALDAFELNDDYVKFELEITMPDGQKIEFEDKK